MRCKIEVYRKYLCIGLLCLLIFGGTQVGRAELKIYYTQFGDFFLGGHTLADGYQWGKQGIVP